jgi:undecaprenyl-diphosphatase
MSRLKNWVQDFMVLPAEEKRHLLWAGGALLFLGVFIRFSWSLRVDPQLDAMDRDVIVAIAKARSSAMNGPAVDITALGSAAIISLFSVLGVALLWLKKDFHAAAYLAVGSIGAGAGQAVMKQVFTRDRPTVVERLVSVDGYSYPSGHSLAATSFYLLLVFITWRHYPSKVDRAVILFGGAMIIGAVAFSRVYLGVHYPSDVLSGMFLGTAWVCLLTAFFSRAQRRKSALAPSRSRSLLSTKG